MAIIKPFKGLRPPKEIAHMLASRPYDVLNSEEARVESNEVSLLRIIKPEIEFAPGKDEHEQDVYEKAAEMFEEFKENDFLIQDDQECLYIYAQTMDGRTQYGLVGCAAVEDYLNNVIKKHELTRYEKEVDRMKHVRATNANMEPVFFAYPEVAEIDAIVADWISKSTVIYNFTSIDGIGHHFWMIDDSRTIDNLVALFAKIPATYVADGHHRTAAAALVGSEKRKNNPNHTGKEEYNFFLAVHFPGNQLKIIDYNRVVKDLNGLSKEEFLEKLSDVFELSIMGTSIFAPDALHTFSMYLDGVWYKLVAKQGTFNDNDPIGVLDVTISSNLILSDILNIKDLRSDKRVDFVGGIRGLGELVKRVDSGEMKVAFALYPVTMKQLFDIADTDNIMPPKTTWFEPKLRSGLIVHALD